MKLPLAMLLALPLAGCERTLPAHVGPCWDVARNLTRSPSTAKLLNYTEGVDKAFISVDAANAYGTPVRMNLQCNFEDNDLPTVVTSAILDGSEIDPAALIEARALAVAEKMRQH